MRRLHGGGPNRYYLCTRCGAIVAQHWHEAPGRALPEAVREEALEILAVPRGEQLGLEL
jgi:hypothetical protein